MSVTRALVRASTPARLVLVLCAVSVVMVFIEPLDWRYEPLWGIWNYNGSLIITGPLVAALTTWDVARTHGIAQLAAVRGTSVRFIVGHVIPATVAMVIGYAVGLVAVLAVLVSAGGVESLTRVDAGVWVSILPVLAYSAIATSLGALLGRLMPKWFAAPLVAVLVYGLEVALFHGGLIGWVTVGGAAGSLVGLAPNPPRYLVQTVAFLALAVLVVAVHNFLSRRSRRSGAGLGAAVAATVAAFALFAPVQSPVFRYGEAVQTCESRSGVEFCVPTDYRLRLAPVIDAVAPHDAALRALGVEMPSRYSATPTSNRHDGLIPTSMLLGDADPSLPMQAAVSAATVGGCDAWSKQEQFDANLLVLQYLQKTSTGSVEGKPVDDAVVSDDPEVVKRAVDRAISLLKEPCPA